MTASIIYKGDLRCECTHLQSGTLIETDAPTDNRGKGERFSPTDLLATSYGSCMITTMAIRAADMKLAFENTKIEEVTIAQMYFYVIRKLFEKNTQLLISNQDVFKITKEKKDFRAAQEVLNGWYIESNIPRPILQFSCSQKF